MILLTSWKVLFRVAALAVVVGCAFVLVTKAVDGVNATDRLSSTTARDQAARDDALYSCLTDQVQKLVVKGTTVAFETDPASEPGMNLYDAAVNWVTVVASPSKATVVFSLESRHGKGSCSGQLVVAKRGGA